jgi:hypothetical protein
MKTKRRTAQSDESIHFSASSLPVFLLRPINQPPLNFSRVYSTARYRGVIVALSIVFASSSLLFAETPVEPRFNVKDYGARADGVTDDSAAFSDAIKTAIRSGKKAVVFVPAGRYSLKTPMDNQDQRRVRETGDCRGIPPLRQDSTG